MARKTGSGWTTYEGELDKQKTGYVGKRKRVYGFFNGIGLMATEQTVHGMRVAKCFFQY